MGMVILAILIIAYIMIHKTYGNRLFVFYGLFPFGFPMVFIAI